MITLFSQRSPKWSDVKLGTSSLTVGEDGCLITSLSMLSAWFGFRVTPDQVALHPGCCDAQGEYQWNYPFPFILEKRIDGRNDAEIMKSLKDPKRGVILQVDNGAHFVLALKKNLFGSYQVADPWFGDTCDAVKRWKNITGSRHLILK